jgi:hypothetical protein
MKAQMLMPQVASISARRPGYYERDLSRQGNLLSAYQPLDKQAKEQPWYKGARGTVLPKAPYTLDFVMLPAATVEGRLVDGTGRPLPARSVSVAGKELPPAQNVLTSVETDPQGYFRLDSVPPHPYWFVFRGEDGQEVRSEPFQFKQAGAYKLELIHDRGDKPRLTMKLLEKP